LCLTFFVAIYFTKLLIILWFEELQKKMQDIVYRRLRTFEYLLGHISLDVRDVCRAGARNICARFILMKERWNKKRNTPK
jgi:hypothetical protein